MRETERREREDEGDRGVKKGALKIECLFGTKKLAQSIEQYSC